MYICSPCGIEHGSIVPEGAYTAMKTECGACGKIGSHIPGRHYGIYNEMSDCCKKECFVSGTTTRFYVCGCCRKSCDLYNFKKNTPGK